MSFDLLFSLFWPFRSLFFRSMPSSKYCFWLQCGAFFAPRAPSAKMSVCIIEAILLISYTICSFLCAFPASNTFFYKTSFYFWKKCSPPSVGSMILKAAQKQVHENNASWASQLSQYAPFWHHLLHPKFWQNPLEKCAFFVYGPFWEATFSIVCLIACI